VGESDVVGFPSPREERAGERWAFARSSRANLTTVSFFFPVCFFLIAVPWPTVIEAPLIQLLTRANTANTIELLGLLGTPAVQHGNVIEIATGLVGIDEACSGIRSLQATLMIALFLGAVYRLSLSRRITLMLSAIALAFVFNVLRTLLLVSIAGQKSLTAMAAWHDPAGVTILVACFLGLWLLSLWLKGSSASVRTLSTASQISSSKPIRDTVESVLTRQGSRLALPALCTPHSALRTSYILALWIAFTELSVQWWYRSHENHLTKNAAWNIAWPTQNATFRQLPMSEAARRILRYDEAFDASWLDDGGRWQAVFLRWNPGRTAVQLAKGHTPEVCLPAAGREIVQQTDLGRLTVQGLQLPFHAYQMRAPSGSPLTSNGTEGPLSHVFYCLWDDAGVDQSFQTESLTYQSRLAPVLAGRRNSGQRSLEIAVWGIAEATEAQAALQRQLQQLIKVDKHP